MAGIKVAHVPYRGDAGDDGSDRRRRLDLQIAGTLLKVGRAEVRALAGTTAEQLPPPERRPCGVGRRLTSSSSRSVSESPRRS